jgi:hypothetical protein
MSLRTSAFCIAVLSISLWAIVTALLTDYRPGHRGRQKWPLT